MSGGSEGGVAAVLELLHDHHRAAAERISLVPSENVLSLAARVPYLTDALYRYSFGESATENPAWPGRRSLAAIEEAAVDDLRHLFGVEHVNVRPISGMNCLTAALATIHAEADVVYSIAEADGGHASTRFIGTQMGIEMRDLPFDGEQGAIDLDALDAALPADRSGLAFYLDQFMCLFPHDIRGLREVVGPTAFVHYDGSHVLGLVAGGQFQDPLGEGADCLAGSTHKSFPGPHKGVALTRSRAVHDRFAAHCSHFVSAHRVADVAALAIAARELRTEAAPYAAAVVANARRLAEGLAAKGFAVCHPERGFTRSHQVWVAPSHGLTAEEASGRLFEAGIVVNAIPLPHREEPTGLRLGVQEVTRLGFGPVEVDDLVALVVRLLVDRCDPGSLRADVAELVRRGSAEEREREREAIELVTRLARDTGGWRP